RFDFSLFQEFCNDMVSTLYIGPFRNAINVGTGSPYWDIDIGQSFIRTWRDWKTGASKARNEAIVKLTNEIRGIFEYSQLEISASADEQTLQFIIDGRSYRLSELGSGLAQFVLVIANAAIKKPAFILIDEPEL